MLQKSVILGIYLLGIGGLFLRNKAKMRYPRNFYLAVWSGLCLLAYFISLELAYKTFYFLIPLALLGIFFFFYFRNKARILNGLLFNIFLLALGGYSVYLMLKTSALFLRILVVVLLLFALFLFAFGLYGLVIFLFANAAVVLKKERPSFANLLTLLLAIGLTIYLISPFILPNLLPKWTLSLLAIPSYILIYFFFIFVNFLTASLLYQLNRPSYNQDYVIVLGAGLLNGDTVTPLLAKRIDRGIQFYRAQSQATLSPPILLMSGGQGSDEKIPEAVAMKNYALKQGIPETDIAIEPRSKTTLENMRFSKEIIEENYPTGYRAIFTSNNYHIFRAGMFAHDVGLKADGIGAKTAKYYLPNAFLREFAAIIMLHKKWHFFVVAALALFGLLLSFIAFKFS